MKLIHVFYRATSLLVATCILIVSCFTFHGCSSYEEDYSVLKENNQVPQVLEYTKLPESNDLVVNLKKSVITQKEISKTLKSANIDNIEAKFGMPNWADNQLVKYDNGQSGIYVPIIKDEKITAFILSKPEEDKFKSIIIEVLSENKEGDEYFSGELNFYTINGANLASYSYDNGKYIPALKSANNQIMRLKSGTTEVDCDFNCVYSCFNNIMTSDWIYGTACATACIAWETGIGLFICIFCIGGPALTCIEQCCPGSIL